MGLGISKHCSPYSIHLMSAKLCEGIGCYGGIQAITFLGNRPSFKTLWHFEIFIMGVGGKNPKMCNILKTADHRAKRMKIWDSQ